MHWFNQGNLHRDDGPAISTPDGSLQYFVRGVCHRENGPAIEGNGQREWQTHGSRHRDDGGPAVIVERNGLALYWFLEGEQHRDDGPALIRIVTDSLDVIRAYWLEGEEVSEQVWRQYCEDEPDLRIWDQDGWLSPASQVLVSSAGLRTTSTVTN